MSRYSDNRATLIEAFKAVHTRAPSLAEAQIMQAVGEKETQWGQGWGQGASTGGVGSNNIGAIQSTTAEAAFEHGDTHEDGTPYQTHFKTYPSLLEGAKDLVRHLSTYRPTTWEAIKAGDYKATAYAMHERDPINGHGVYHETNPEGYYTSLQLLGQKIANDLGESLVSPTSFFTKLAAVACVIYVGRKLLKWSLDAVRS